MGIFSKFFKSYSEKEIQQLEKIVVKINEHIEEYKSLTDEQLQHKTVEFKQRIEKGETLDDILPEAFAACSEADYRVLGMRPYRVQLLGGIILHQGRIAELRTGEGKTLTATLPCYLNALSGKGVHVVTVNDYLAKRDSDWMGKVYRFMGLSVGLIVHGVMPSDRRKAYAADITYGTNNEYGFDYLRDNMAVYGNELVQRGHNFAIVDEVDSILIDEARTPLIISGQGDKSTELYSVVDHFVSKLRYEKVAKVDEKEVEADDIDVDYVVDEKARTATLTSLGIAKAEKAFNIENITDPENTTLLHHINQAIKAHGVMQRDIDYTVRDGQVIIVDEFTGRLMFGRRYNEGLHQAIEAKEHVKIENESKTLATITFQNYFRLYNKISGMTGTAMTEKDEFGTIYKLDIVEVPTNKPIARIDNHDAVFKTEAGKLRAVVKKIKECNEKGQPVLVGTVSIDKSEKISEMIKREGIKHNVLNAKNHEKEAEIVAQAGKFGAVTVATNMAGRGTDIMLGGNADFLAKQELVKLGYDDAVIAEAVGFAHTDNQDIIEAREKYGAIKKKYQDEIDIEAEKVREAGGLFIIGTERHESRRIDNQLRGRAGRQGDPGETKFYLSLEDDILRLFGAEHIMNVMSKLGIDEDTPIEQKMLTNTIANAQTSVESRNFQIRKNTLEYDDVMNKQREIIYDQRGQILRGDNMHNHINNMKHAVAVEIAARHCMDSDNKTDAEIWNGVVAELRESRLLHPAYDGRYELEVPYTYSVEGIADAIETNLNYQFEAKEKDITPIIMREVERVVLLRVVDEYWMEHIDSMSELRRGIGLRAYAQTNPVDAYKQEGFDMFEQMIQSIKEETVKRILNTQVNIQVRVEGNPSESETNTEKLRDMSSVIKREKVAKITGTSGGSLDGTLKKQPIKNKDDVGRNDICPCGSGLKFKKCTCDEYHSN